MAKIGNFRVGDDRVGRSRRKFPILEKSWVDLAWGKGIDIPFVDWEIA